MYLTFVDNVVFSFPYLWNFGKGNILCSTLISTICGEGTLQIIKGLVVGIEIELKKFLTSFCIYERDFPVLFAPFSKSCGTFISCCIIPSNELKYHYTK